VELVADTDIVISGLLWLGIPGQLLEAAATGALTLYTSPALVDELTVTLRAAKLAPRVRGSGLTLDELLKRYLEVAIVVAAPTIAPVLSTDPDDDHVLACALGAHADLIVSGDADLLNLKAYQAFQLALPLDLPESRLERPVDADAGIDPYRNRTFPWF